MTSIGIYAIVNKINGKKYIGSSINLSKRQITHFSNMRKGKSHNILINRAVEKYGLENFYFQIMMVCDSEDYARLIEQRLIDVGYGEYNISKTSSGGDCITSHPDLDEIRNKHRINWKKLKDENGGVHPSLANRNNLGANNPNFKGWITRTKCVDCGEMKKNHNKRCHACNRKFLHSRTGDKNPFYGKTHSEDTKSTLREKSIERSNDPNFKTKQHKPVIIDGVEYKSLGFAAKALGCSVATIFYRIRSKNRKFSGYYYKDEGSTTSESVAPSGAKQEPPNEGDDIV